MKRKSRDRVLLSTSPSAHSKTHLKATTLRMMYIQDYQQNGTGWKYAQTHPGNLVGEEGGISINRVEMACSISGYGQRAAI